MQPRYVFRSEGPIFVRDRRTADPQKIGEELERARQATPDGGDIRETAIERARSRKNYLHKLLQWDNEIAGHEYRKVQLNHLICSIRRLDDNDEEQFAWISVTPHRERKRFATPEEIVTSAGMQMAILESADRDLRQFKERYSHLADVCEDIERVRQRIQERRRAMGGEADNNANAA